MYYWREMKRILAIEAGVELQFTTFVFIVEKFIVNPFKSCNIMVMRSISLFPSSRRVFLLLQQLFSTPIQSDLLGETRRLNRGCVTI